MQKLFPLSRSANKNSRMPEATSGATPKEKCANKTNAVHPSIFAKTHVFNSKAISIFVTHPFWGIFRFLTVCLLYPPLWVPSVIGARDAEYRIDSGAHNRVLVFAFADLYGVFVSTRDVRGG